MHRTLNIRSDIGICGTIIQQNILTMRHVAFTDPILLIVRQGSKTLSGGNRQTTVQAGEMLVIAGGQTLDVINRSPVNGTYQADWLQWDASLLNRYTPTAGTPIRDWLSMPVPAAGLQQAFTQAQTAIADQTLPTAIASHRLHELLVWISLSGGCITGDSRRSISKTIRRTFSSNPGKNWSASEIASDLAMSEATLRRHLARENQTLRNLLIDVRMTTALTLLQTTEYSVTRIALDVGYASPSRFTARFQQRFGFPPSAIRQRLSAATS